MWWKGGEDEGRIVREREQGFEKKFVFWNVERKGKRGKEFWKYIKNFEAISLCETWVDEKGWESLRERLTKSHAWACSFTVKNKNRGRAKDFIIAKKRGNGLSMDVI